MIESWMRTILGSCALQLHAVIYIMNKPHMLVHPECCSGAHCKASHLLRPDCQRCVAKNTCQRERCIQVSSVTLQLQQSRGFVRHSRGTHGKNVGTRPQSLPPKGVQSWRGVAATRPARERQQPHLAQAAAAPHVQLHHQALPPPVAQLRDAGLDRETKKICSR